MRIHLLTSLFLATAGVVSAQTPDDAIRQSYQIQQGSARNMAVGGAMGSLGGDISAAHVNPAGLGFYKSSEFVISPGFNFLNNKFDFRGTNLEDKKSNFVYGTSGFVFGWGNTYNNKKSNAFSITVNQVANFNNITNYKGFNNVSSWSEQYLEQLIRDRASESQAEQNYIFGSSLAFRTYLIDTSLNANGQLEGYQSLVPISQGVDQQNLIETKGGVHEIALALASNNNDKLYLGATLGVPIYSYTKDQTYRESDATDNPNNNFSFFEYRENYISKGVGVNLKLGLIYKPVERLRLGIAVHTPTFANMTDKIRSSIETNTEAYYPGTLKETSDNLNSGNPGEYKYTMTTPWKAMVSGSYVFNEVSDVTRQKAFITADLEYVNHKGTQYDITEGGTDADQAYYETVNKAIDQRYKGAINLRVGGEVKFTTIMARAGFAYYGNPYQDAELKNNRMLVSGGLGYRNRGIFVDLTYVYSMLKEINVPYYLSDRPNTFAEGKNNKGNIMLTFGVKL